MAKVKRTTLCMMVILSLLITTAVKAQLNPMGSIYYQNQFLANPAMAGLESGFNLNTAFKAQWANVSGAPKIQYLTADYGFTNNKVGLGVLVYGESAGVINRLRSTISYAYHLELGEEGSFLDFGLATGIMNEWVDLSKSKGDLSDDVLNSFNSRKIYLDGDFGLAFRNNNLTIQGTLPNLKRFFKRDINRNLVDRSTYFLAGSYKFISNDHLISLVEPKIVYRGIENYKGILDVGINLQLVDEKFLLSSIYHSSKSVTFGVGAMFNKSKFGLLFQYTTNTAVMQNYSNGEFEVGLKYSYKRY